MPQCRPDRFKDIPLEVGFGCDLTVTLTRLGRAGTSSILQVLHKGYTTTPLSM